MPDEQEPQENQLVNHLNQPRYVVPGDLRNAVWGTYYGQNAANVPIPQTGQEEAHYARQPGIYYEPEAPEHYYPQNEETTPVLRNRDNWGQAVANRMPDTYALNDETGIGDWRFQELPKKKSNEIKIVTIDKETFGVLRELTDEIIKESLISLENIYKNRLDFIENMDYNGLLESAPQRVEGERAPESESFLNFENTLTSWDELTKGDVISNYGYQHRYLTKLEEKAKQRYNIEHSKYKYYPRLKGAVKYGNPELLAKVLTVAQIGKGKVICK